MAGMRIMTVRNNSGKSSCIDMIENLIYPETFARRRQEQNNIKMEIGYLLTDYDINRVFQKGYGGGGISGRKRKAAVKRLTH